MQVGSFSVIDGELPTKPCFPCVNEVRNLGIVFRDGLWAGEVAEGFDIPGWVMLRTRRHVERITSLNDAELSSFPFRLRDLISAVSEVMDSPVTYFVSFNERNPHFHVLIIPRPRDLKRELRSWNIARLKEDARDSAVARRAAPELRASYDRFASRMLD